MSNVSDNGTEKGTVERRHMKKQQQQRQQKRDARGRYAKGEATTTLGSLKKTRIQRQRGRQKQTNKQAIARLNEQNNNFACASNLYIFIHF